MTEQELGLALGQQLLGIQDLHYGLWDDDLELNFSNLAVAQRRFANLIASELPDPAVNETHILDVGCGTGHILSLLTQQGYQVDAVSPSHFLIELVKQRLADLPDSTSKVFESKFEDFPEQIYQQYYDVILFNESFNEISMSMAISKVQRLLKPGGLIIICDSFLASTSHVHTDTTIKHELQDFYRQIDRSPFSLLRDDDITQYVVPTIELVDEFLKNKLKPAGETVGQYLLSNNPVLSKIGSFLLKKKFSQLNKKYFTQLNKQALQNGTASYRFIVMQLVKPV